MTEPHQELHDWVEENDADLDVAPHPNVPEDGDWLLHVEDDDVKFHVVHFTEEDGGIVMYGDFLEKTQDGRQYDLMIQEELMIQEIPKLGSSLRFKPQPDTFEVAIGRDDEGILRAKVVGS